MFRKPIFRSITIHFLIVFVALLFLFFKSKPNEPIALPIELQIADVHVHHHEGKPSLAPRKEQVETPVKPVKKAAELSMKSEPAPEHSEAEKPSESSGGVSSWDKFSSDEKNQYLTTLLRMISAHKFYPRSSILNEEQGTVQLRVSLNGQGKILACEIAKSSGYTGLDDAAVKTLKGLGTLPMPAPNLKGLVLVIPIRYEINPDE